MTKLRHATAGMRKPAFGGFSLPLISGSSQLDVAYGVTSVYTIADRT